MTRAAGPSGEYWTIQTGTAEGRSQQAGHSRQGKTGDEVRNECQGQNTVVSREEIRSEVKVYPGVIHRKQAGANPRSKLANLLQLIT